MTLPIIILTGFLGSGKTTLLNRLLRGPAFAETAVIINEFGQVSLDHLIVESAIENTFVLSSGCVCCTVRADLIATLLDMADRRERGELPPFERLIIETTGLADPASIIHTLMRHPFVTRSYHLAKVVTVIDAMHGNGQLDAFSEAVSQAALADVVLITKADFVGQVEIARLEARLGAMNPGAQIARCSLGVLDAGLVLKIVSDSRARAADLGRWLNSGASAHMMPSPHAAGNLRKSYRHSDDVGATCLTLGGDIAWEDLSRWLQSLISLRGAAVLRLKGVVSLRGEVHPIIIQAVQHVVYPVEHLPAWRDADRRTRIVVIGRNIDPDGLAASLQVASEYGPPF